MTTWDSPSINRMPTVLGLAVLVVFSHAAPQHYHQATSYSAFNEHHNTVHHIQSAPALIKAIPIHSAPVHIAPAPLAIKSVAPVIAAPHSSAQSYSSLSISHPAASVSHYAAPAPAKYEFAYGVEDHHTGDIHSHKEARNGDLTQGEYSLHEADGTVRTVKYTVDKHSGFNAIVERSGHAVHAQPAPIAKAIISAPAYQHHY
ncbi:hypothetical protein NQ314_006253 [Rhamnusium bicolor]|uniref:Uncharacterized protein n=1 Tax=Rhamnusium bicolor TaxID=1586634 RepID=A0AAV8Z7P2_9CUCU|nr:hypothetical protein NQ314_006253 [Rhamnusium bicolor]